MPPLTIEYPRIVEYAEALQHPHKCLRATDLLGSLPETDARGHPMPRTGVAAAVFKLKVGNTSVALKVFKSFNDLREQRYRAVSDYLHPIHSRYLVHFAYTQDGIRVPRSGETYRDAQWYPVLRMEWVAGVPLKDWIELRVRQRDVRALERLADRWSDLLGQLKRLRIAHGDLQHGNVMVVDNDVVLIDYDGMCVPALEGQEAAESGLPGYQHPLRGRQPLSPNLDDFSAWIVWIALRAVAVDPGLWHRHVAAVENENLLFTAQDIHDPERSPLWRDLLALQDAEVVRRARELRESLDQPFDRVPAFSLDRFQQLREALAESPSSDVKIAAALDAFQTTGLPQMDAENLARCELARRRRRGLLGIREIPADLPFDRQDEEYLRCWQEGGLHDCGDVTDPERRRFQEAGERSLRSRELLAVVTAGDAAAVRILADDPALAGYPPVEAVRDRINAFLEEHRRIQRVLNLLQDRSKAESVRTHPSPPPPPRSGEGGQDALPAPPLRSGEGVGGRGCLTGAEEADVDLSCVALHPEMFREYKEGLQAHLQREMDQVVLRPQGEPELVGEGASRMVHVRWTGWTWRTLGLGEQTCKVAVSSEGFFDAPMEGRCSQVRHRAYSADRGVKRAVPLGVGRLFVTVWPILRLETLDIEAVGQPLHLPVVVPAVEQEGGLRKLLKRMFTG